MTPPASPPLNHVIRRIIDLRASRSSPGPRASLPAPPWTAGILARPARQITLLAVCPNSGAVLEAAIKAAAASHMPMLFAATLNQVDRDGGYTGWTPKAFVTRMKELAGKYRCSSPLYHWCYMYCTCYMCCKYCVALDTQHCKCRTMYADDSRTSNICGTCKLQASTRRCSRTHTYGDNADSNKIFHNSCSRAGKQESLCSRLTICMTSTRPSRTSKDSYGCNGYSTNDATVYKAGASGDKDYEDTYCLRKSHRR